MNRVAINRRIAVLFVALLLFSAFITGKSFGAPQEPADSKQKNISDEQTSEPGDKEISNRLTREGLVVDFTVDPLTSREADDTALMEGDYARVTFRITDEDNGKPVSGLYPAAWMDIGKPWEGEAILPVNCKDRVGLYLQGTVGFRPLIDLNSYFVLVMNRDATISVVDPLVGITGITQLYAMITLKRPGGDWAKTSDDKRMFVTMPLAEEVAVVDTDTFKVIENLKAGKNPMRIAIQPDEQYLWVGNDSQKSDESGVTVIDVKTRRIAAQIPTGRGHHELAISADDRYVYVSNRDEGTVSVIDIRTLAKVKDIKTGPLPIALAYSPLSQALYVADAQTGIISVIGGDHPDLTAQIETKPGLGPLRFSQDGRWGLAANPRENEVYIIDAATNRTAHTIAVEGRPYQVAFSRSFAYVRALDSERVSMIELQHLGKAEKPPVVTFAAGDKAPSLAADLSIADGIAEAPGEAAALIVSPADMTVYYYMEGMNAPMGALRNYGHLPRAVNIVDRALREREPGVYSGEIRLPTAGTYDIAFLLDAPRILHCFNVSARPNPSLEPKGPAVAVEYLLKERKVAAGDTVRLRFRLTDPATQQPRTDLKDVSVLYFAAPGQLRTETPAQEVEDGIYEAALPIRRAGAYYIYVGVPSVHVKYDDLPHTTLLGVRQKSSPALSNQFGG